MSLKRAPKRSGISRPLIVVIALVVMIGAALAIWAMRAKRAVPITAATQPATTAENPTTQTAKAVAAPEPAKPIDYIGVVRSAYPDFPATQPLGIPLDLKQAAHIVLKDPVYLSSSPRADLWITRSDAEPTAKVLKDAIDPKKDVQIHITRERVCFVHWIPNDNGPWPANLICPTTAGGFEVVNSASRRPLPRHDYRFDHAMSWNEKLVVPCATGVSVLQLEPTITEAYHELAPAGAVVPGSSFSDPQILLDWRGLLAWLPWEDKKAGGRGAARFVDGRWVDLTPDAGVPEKVIHLVPLNDGTLLILSVGDDMGVQLSLSVLDHVDIDPAKINPLVVDLADPDEDKRQAAYKQLTTYGSGIWPMLEKMLDDQPPEAQARLRLLLKDKVEPTLAGMKLVGDRKLKLAARLDDGGVVFYAEAGVMIPSPNPDVDPKIVAPVWLSLRPGAPIEMLPPPLITDLKPGISRLYAVGGDWLVSSDVRGPRRFIGNGTVNLLHKSEIAYSDVIGQDRRGRWLFRKSAIPQTFSPFDLATSALAGGGDETLIIDPTLPDPLPRLPSWVFKTAKITGWDKDNWPVAKDASAYALHEDGWQLLDETEKVFTKPSEIPGPTSGPTSAPASAPSDATGPLLVDRQGNRYFGGLTDLRVSHPDGRETFWTFPVTAVGQGPATLLKTADGHLFLYNESGRILRLSETPNAAQPFHLDATFTRNIPSADSVVRLWLDPADRIIFAWDNRLTILFPAGYIPPVIAEKMLDEPDPDAQ